MGTYGRTHIRGGECKQGLYDQPSSVEKMEHDYARKILSEALGIAMTSEEAFKSTFIPYTV
ncbi:hypothetical protein BGZ95_003219 [Linnemannia exigua]|uniref:Uncharacterized protein n=1 Tax=Linnemannia exigua TaxID=604196 RepID=A0AAD4DI35_9FUNG|nr:hypothetical protein BGZ95_003219 [Linnemannia exigua]